jgi:hypothetical protein
MSPSWEFSQFWQLFPKLAMFAFSGLRRGGEPFGGFPRGYGYLPDWGKKWKGFLGDRTSL